MTTHLSFVLRLKISGAVTPPLLYVPSFHGAPIKNRDNYKPFTEFQKCVFPTLFKGKDLNLIFNGPKVVSHV